MSNETAHTRQQVHTDPEKPDVARRLAEAGSGKPEHPGTQRGGGAEQLDNETEEVVAPPADEDPAKPGVSAAKVAAPDHGPKRKS